MGRRICLTDQQREEKACEDTRKLISAHIGAFRDSARFGQKKKRMTQEEAAEQIGVKEWSIRSLEQGKPLEIGVDDFIKMLPKIGLMIAPKEVLK